MVVFKAPFSVHKTNGSVPSKISNTKNYCQSLTTDSELYDLMIKRNDLEKIRKDFRENKDGTRMKENTSKNFETDDDTWIRVTTEKRSFNRPP